MVVVIVVVVVVVAALIVVPLPLMRAKNRPHYAKHLCFEAHSHFALTRAKNAAACPSGVKPNNVGRKTRTSCAGNDSLQEFLIAAPLSYTQLHRTDFLNSVFKISSAMFYDSEDGKKRILTVLTAAPRESAQANALVRVQLRVAAAAVVARLLGARVALEGGHVAGAQDVLLSEDGGSHQNDLGHRVKHGVLRRRH